MARGVVDRQSAGGIDRGQIRQALKTTETGIQKQSDSIPLRLLNVEALRFNDDADDAKRRWGRLKSWRRSLPVLCRFRQPGGAGAGDADERCRCTGGSGNILRQGEKG